MNSENRQAESHSLLILIWMVTTPSNFMKQNKFISYYIYVAYCFWGSASLNIYSYIRPWTVLQINEQDSFLSTLNQQDQQIRQFQNGKNNNTDKMDCACTQCVCVYLYRHSLRDKWIHSKPIWIHMTVIVQAIVSL